MQNGISFHRQKLRDCLQLPYLRLSAVHQARLLSDIAAIFLSICFTNHSVIFLYPLVANSFTNLLTAKPWNSYRF